MSADMKNFINGENTQQRLMEDLLKLKLGDFDQAYANRKRHYD